MRKILKMNDLPELQTYAGLDQATLLHADRHMFQHLGEGQFLLSFHFCDIRNATRKDAKVIVYCSPQHLVYVSDNAECRKFAERQPEEETTYRQLLDFFIVVCADDLHELEKIEDRITKLEDGMLTIGKRLDVTPTKIIAIRRQLLYIKRYYEQLRLIVGELAEADTSPVPADMQPRFGAFARRLDRLLSSVLHLREYITQVREAYQAQIDIQQNQIMKVFTVISGVFLPLTLIVGWYGMNLKMPELDWSFGYAYVIGLSIVVLVGCLAFFRIKKWF